MTGITLGSRRLAGVSQWKQAIGGGLEKHLHHMNTFKCRAQSTGR